MVFAKGSKKKSNEVLIPRRRNWKKALRRYWQLYLIIIPAIVAVFIFHYVPIYGVQIAFRDYRASKGIWGSNWVGLKHFIKFVNYPNFWKIIKNTLSVTLYSLTTFPLAIILALMLNEVTNAKYKKFVQMVSYAPHFVSTVVVCSMVMLFTNYSNGLFNNMRETLGLSRIDIITDPDLFVPIYVWSGVWQGLGWGTIIYIAALSNISTELIEAARIDGANRMQVIWHVNIPCILPTVVIMLIMRMGDLLDVGFEKIFLLQNSLNMSASRVLSTYVYEVGIGGGQYSYSAAIGLFNNVISVIMVVCTNKIAKKISGVGLW